MDFQLLEEFLQFNGGQCDSGATLEGSGTNLEPLKECYNVNYNLHRGCIHFPKAATTLNKLLCVISLQVVAKCKEISGKPQQYFVTGDMSKLEDTEKVIKVRNWS